MDYCNYIRVCAHKLDCGEWYDVGICDYYGYYVRGAKLEYKDSICKRECKHLSNIPTKQHLEMCKSCEDRFYCWTSNYWQQKPLEIHRTNVYHGTIRKARAKVRS